MPSVSGVRRTIDARIASYVWPDTSRTLATATGPSKILEAHPSFDLSDRHCTDCAD
jgi:hypothetical protein